MTKTHTWKYRLKKAAKLSFRAAGYDLRRIGEVPAYVPNIRHAEISCGATYSPWLSDEEFQRTHERIRSHTLVDRYRCYELWQLVEESSKLSGGDFIEVGVWRGGTGALIAHKRQLLNIENPVYLCDTFQGVVKTGVVDAVYKGGEHSDTSEETVKALCRGLGLKGVHILKGIFPEDSGDAVKGRLFRFCHIDVDVYQSAKDIVEWIWPRMVPGGIFVFDDYGSHSCPGITQFVNEERSKPDRLVFYNLNGHAVVIKTGGLRDSGHGGGRLA